MAEVNNDNIHTYELLGDGEVINEEKNGGLYPFAFVRDGEDLRWWEYTIQDNSNLLEIPDEFSYIFFNPNQRQIMLIDQENGEKYSCGIYFGMPHINGIFVGNGWSDYVKAKGLNTGSTVFLGLFGDNPHNLHVIVLDRT